MTTHSLTAAGGWTLLTQTAGSYRVDLGSQGPVWLSGVVTSIPSADDYSTYALEQAVAPGYLDFTLESGDKLYARAKSSQTISIEAAPSVSGVAELAASVAALAALIGTDADDAGDPTVFGYLKQIDVNTTP